MLYMSKVLYDLKNKAQIPINGDLVSKNVVAV